MTPRFNVTRRALLGQLTLLGLPVGKADAQGEAKPELTAALDPAQVEETIRRVADWQLGNPVDYPPGHWTLAPLYDGLIDASLVTGDPSYLAAVIRAGRQIRFAPG